MKDLLLDCFQFEFVGGDDCYLDFFGFRELGGSYQCFWESDYIAFSFGLFAFFPPTCYFPKFYPHSNVSFSRHYKRTTLHNNLHMYLYTILRNN